MLLIPYPFEYLEDAFTSMVEQAARLHKDIMLSTFHVFFGWKATFRNWEQESPRLLINTTLANYHMFIHGPYAMDAVARLIWCNNSLCT